MQIIVSGLMSHYERRGNGKTVLLLHGWGDNMRTFNPLIPSLDGFELIRLDLPGFGKTEMPPEAWNLDDYAEYIARFLEKLQIDSLYAVIGHSNGGALAVRAVSLGKMKLNKLILLASSGVRNPAIIRRQAVKLVAKTGKLVTFWLPKSARQKLRQKLYGTVGSDMLVAPHLQETFKLTVRQDIQQDAAKVVVPTLLIYGQQDRATPLPYARRLHELIKGSRLEVLSDAGHFVHQDQPEKVASLIKRFLS